MVLSETYNVRGDATMRGFIGRAAVAGAVLIGLLPGTAWAPRVTGVPGQTGDCSVTIDGVTSDGSFLGALSISGFEAKGSDLVAHVSLTGSCTVAGEAHGISDAGGTATTTLSNATCDSVELSFVGSVAEKDVVVVDLSDMNITLEKAKGTSGILCRLGRTLDRMSAGDVAGVLNRYLAK
jgi:hypothetical protein